MKPKSGDDQTAYSKARTFYQSCTKRGKPTKSFLNSVIEEFGGWRLTGNFNTSITFNERVCTYSDFKVVRFIISIYVLYINLIWFSFIGPKYSEKIIYTAIIQLVC